MYRYKLTILGMKCGMCESHINDTIRRFFNVSKVTSSKSKNLTIIETKEPLDEDKIRKVIRPTGYELTKIESETFEKKKFLFF